MFLLDKGVPKTNTRSFYQRAEEKYTKPWIGEGVFGSPGLNDGFESNLSIRLCML